MASDSPFVVALDRALEIGTTGNLVPVRPLTPRQLEIAQRVGAGMPYAAIALELRITAGHVRSRVAKIAALFPVVEGLTPYRLVSRYASEYAREFAVHEVIQERARELKLFEKYSVPSTMAGVTARSIERLCEEMHVEWLDKNAQRELRSVESDSGEELMVPWIHLSQRAREDLHRRDARRVLFTLARLGFTMTPLRTLQ